MHENSRGKRGKSSPEPSRTHLQVTAAGELMPFLMANLPAQSRNNVKSLLSHRQVLVDNQVVTHFDHPLQAGQEVVINWALVRSQTRVRGCKIIYEDRDLLVIDKPAGLLSMASDAEKHHTAYRQLTDYVRLDHPEGRIFIVHRLDRDTSGVMLFAKSEAIKRALQDNWKEAVTDRAYIAVVEGRVKKQSDTIKSWLLETKTGLMYSSTKPGDGLEAVTHYRLLQANDRYSLLEIRLETGRKNQIRTHMKDIGHFIAGDKKYGAATNPLGRLALHAHILAFHHPASGELLRFETEVPPAFTRLCK